MFTEEVAEGDEGPVVVPVVVEPVLVQLAVVAVEDRVGRVEVAAGVAPARARSMLSAAQVTAPRILLGLNFMRDQNRMAENTEFPL